ncbi:MAG TPA: S8 family serine peptidase [Pilimelia sp.]|nr:S8 family serine peptidase [Pilimelia sp.]
MPAGERTVVQRTRWQAAIDDGRSVTLANVRRAIGADTGTAATLNGTGVGIAMIDTGVVSVPGLPPSQIVNGPDLSFESQAPLLRYNDGYGHGTHLAGIMVGNETTTGTYGLSRGAKLTSIKVGTGTGAVDVSQVMAAVDWVVENRNHDPAYPIKVLTLAYGTISEQSPSVGPLHFALEKAWEAGILVVVAGGNGVVTAALTNPATDPFVLSVGAAAGAQTADPADDTESIFTNLGTKRVVDLLAPGSGIVSLRDPGSNIDNTYPTARVGDRLFRGSGSSQAAAVTAAAAALLLQSKPNLTPDQAKQMLISSGTPLTRGRAATLKLRSLHVGRALTAPVPAATSSTESRWSWWGSNDSGKSDGSGDLKDARGAGGIRISGTWLWNEASVFGNYSSRRWTDASKDRTAWSGGRWMDHQLAGNGWGGSSFASKTWQPAAWSFRTWTGSTWFDPAWNGRYWSGRYWSAGVWSGRYWSSEDWSGAHWG